MIWIELDPTKGHEQRGHRPALVLSPRAYNERTALCVACPITGRAKGYPFETEVSGGGGITGVVLVDQVRSLSWMERHASLAGQVSAELLDDVREKLAALVGIN